MSDLISREDAIDAICDEWCYVTYSNCPHCDDGFKCDGCDDVKRLESLPSADKAFIPIPKNCAECWEKCLHVAVDCNAKGDCGRDGDKRKED